ncbi:hypothetical protein [Metamycoplasma auris]|uniref:Uncharacterized protein n=1 Tax=Metamycoplasma auris TaxID=51363 RepID=A0A2W7GWE5_9BACT|nr:hypothetical protein [Metamycoplasma auris]PZW01539.1 hypothetical protein BCF89_10159 [Metamycoplasma auris]
MNTFERLKNVVFHTIGTNCNAYIKRFQDKYKNTSFFYDIDVGDSLIYLYDDNNKIIDLFKGKSTYKQFISVLLSFGFIENGIGKYIIKKTKFDYDYITEILFEKSNTDEINIIRQSRFITLLLDANYINNDNYASFELRGIRSKEPQFNKMKLEISDWEKQTTNDFKRLANVLSKLDKYDFIKKEKENEQ